MADVQSFFFPTDFSAYAEHAFHYALAFVKRYGGQLHIAHVVDPELLSHGTSLGLWVTDADREKVLNSLREHVQSRLEHLAQMADSAGVAALSHVATGNPATEICRMAEALRSKLILIGTHGRSGFDRYVYGSTCEKVVRLSTTPVLSIKQPAARFVRSDSTVELKRILCPCDFSEFSSRAVPLAAGYCREFGATLVLAHVAERAGSYPNFMPEMELKNSPQIMSQARQALEALADDWDDISVEVQVLRGIPHREIVQLVSAKEIDLVVMATHGRSGIAHALFGSVAEKVVRAAPCPVITIRATPRRAFIPHRASRTPREQKAVVR